LQYREIHHSHRQLFSRLSIFYYFVVLNFVGDWCYVDINTSYSLEIAINLENIYEERSFPKQCFSDHAWAVTADFSTSPFLRFLRCSFTLVFKFLLVFPMSNQSTDA
ncbi:hypothetical protein L9F63_002060, partial [Diploptera punctata]